MREHFIAGAEIILTPAVLKDRPGTTKYLHASPESIDCYFPPAHVGKPEHVLTRDVAFLSIPNLGSALGLRTKTLQFCI